MYKRNYSSSIGDDALNDFIKPEMKGATKYRRMTGHFSSSFLVSAAEIFAEYFSSPDRKMEIVCCKEFIKKDYDAIASGLTVESIIEDSIFQELETLEEKIQYLKNNSLDAFERLLKSGSMEIKIVVPNSGGLFHQKIGLFYREDRNSSFIGGFNLSQSGHKFNSESCAPSLHSVDFLERERIFNVIWEDISPNERTYAFPDACGKKILKVISEEVFRRKNDNKNTSRIGMPLDIEPRPYQLEAVDNWKKAGYRGIFDMATGTGKTKTALMALTKLYNDLDGDLAVFITCPYKHLTDMWKEELDLFGIDSFIAHSESPDWRKTLMRKVEIFKGMKKMFCAVCVNNTFTQKDIQDAIEGLSERNVLLISDEVHRMGSESNLRSLAPSIKYRLGLSATVERINDPVGTQALFNYFGGKCISYPLEEAISSGMLSEYYYYPILCYFTEEEYSNMIQINKEIDELSSSNDPFKRSKIRELKVQGANILARMEDKFSKLESEASGHEPSEHMLFYCGATRIDIGDNDDDDGSDDFDRERIVDFVSRLLREKCDIETSQFTYKEDLVERRHIIDDFTKGRTSGIVAIRCLDEGVNIPNIKTAFILSSSEDPKEYIQRRGRVLRKAEGKKYAEIYDFVALPREISMYHSVDDFTKELELRLIARELKRVIEFGALSKNKEFTDDIISEIGQMYEIENLKRYVNECR